MHILCFYTTIYSVDTKHYLILHKLSDTSKLKDFAKEFLVRYKLFINV